MALPPLTFRRDIARPLNVTEFDGNTDNLDGRLTAVESSPPSATSIDDITAAGDQLTILLTDATTRGPFTIPTVTYRSRGTWAPFTAYALYDTFDMNGGFYEVTFAHTSAASFDPDATDGLGHNYYHLNWSTPSNSLPTGGTERMVLLKRSDDDYDYDLEYVSAHDVTFSPSTESALISDNVFDALVELEGMLGGGGGAFADLSDVVLTAPASGDVALYDGADWLNVPLAFSIITGTATPSQRHVTPVVLGTSGTVWIDCSAADVFTITPSGAVTLGISFVEAGSFFTLIVTTSGTSSYNITFNSGASFKANGTLATGVTSGKMFAVTFACDGTWCIETGRVGPL